MKQQTYHLKLMVCREKLLSPSLLTKELVFFCPKLFKIPLPEEKQTIITIVLTSVFHPSGIFIFSVVIFAQLLVGPTIPCGIG